MMTSVDTYVMSSIQLHLLRHCSLFVLTSWIDLPLCTKTMDNTEGKDISTADLAI